MDGELILKKLEYFIALKKGACKNFLYTQFYMLCYLP